MTKPEKVCQVVPWSIIRNHHRFLLMILEKNISPRSPPIKRLVNNCLCFFAVFYRCMTSLYCVTMGWQSFTEFLNGTTFWLLLGKNQRKTKQNTVKLTLFLSLFNRLHVFYFWFCRFHVEICVFLLSLVVLPTRGICFMLVNWFFLANEVVFHSEYLTYDMLTWLIPWLIFQCEWKSILNDCCDYFIEFLKYGEKCWGVSLSPIPLKDNGPSRVSYIQWKSCPGHIIEFNH